MKRTLIFVFIFVSGVFLGAFWPKNTPETALEVGPLQNAEKITGLYIPDRFKVLNYYYQNTGNAQLNSHGDKYYGYIDISNPSDRYYFREFAEKNKYISLPYIGQDSVLLHLNYGCKNKLSYNGSVLTKGYYKIETTDREKKVVLFDEACGVLFFYYELTPL